MTIHAAFDDFCLRDIARADAPALVRHLNDMEVAGWLARPPYPYLPEHAEEFFARGPDGWPSRAAIDAGGKLVGVVSIDPHLGYWLAPAFWGRGIMSRAARTILCAHFAVAGSGPVTSGVFEGNETSLAVLKKLGFRETTRSMEYCLPQRRERPHIGMTLTRENWEARNGR